MSKRKLDIDELYVHQINGYGIGNFINCTPTIKYLSDYYHQKIPVYFDNGTIKRMYENCPFIDILNEKEASKKECLFSSALVNGWIPDWLFIYKKVLKRQKIKVDLNNIPHTYVDSYPTLDAYQDKKYVVIIRGMVDYTPYWIKMKDPGDTIYKYIIEKLEKEYQIVFIGGESDYNNNICRMETWCDGYVQLNSIQKSLGLIAGASLVVSNDTGMYHASGALNKKIFVMWKKTLFKKNQSPGLNCFYSRLNRWQKDFDSWLDLIEHSK
ncbi:MAG: hypothetical protein A2Y40_09300 [Candidatus Margulisbacteria bacterium GWF2_35_9]|nr:MAG: hypothetical protein A2Y40_09300 [Candidatus Margulisbacteria bacterium GWF2_35_9]